MFKSCKDTITEIIDTYSRNKRKSRILDAGCGTGEYSSFFKRNENALYGIDIQNRIEEQYKYFITYCVADGTKLPFKDCKFDTIISFDVIEHVERDEHFLQELHRVLKGNGEIFLSTPNKNRLSNRLLKLSGHKIEYPMVLGEDENLGKCVHLREYDFAELYELLEIAGFKEIQITPVWLGLRFKFLDIGLTRIPKLCNSLVQYWFVLAKK